MGDYDGLVAIVTGGSSGIGAAVCDLLSQRGARAVSLDLNPPAEGIHVPCDVSSTESVDAAIARVAQDHGGIDIVVNNAGVGAAGDVSQNDPDEWRRVIDINVVGMARVSASALPHLRRSRVPAIVNVSSIVAVVGLPQRALYSASKGAVMSLTLAMAADHVGEGIRVNAVAPGTADTPWVSRLLASTDDPDAALASLRARQPMGRLVTAAEVAHAIAYLASPLSASTTGTILGVDGGLVGLRLPR